MKTHIGMDYKAKNGSRMFCLQLLNSEGTAQAVVDIDDGLVTRVLVVQKLALRQTALIRLAQYHYRKTA